MKATMERIISSANDMLACQRAWKQAAEDAWKTTGAVSVEASRYSRQLTRVRWIAGSLPHGEQCRPGDCRCAVSDLRVVLGIDCAVCLRGIHHNDPPLLRQRLPRLQPGKERLMETYIHEREREEARTESYRTVAGHPLDWEREQRAMIRTELNGDDK